MKAAHEMGLTFYVAPDIEFFYFEPLVPGEVPSRSTKAGSST